MQPASAGCITYVSNPFNEVHKFIRDVMVCGDAENRGIIVRNKIRGGEHLSGINYRIKEMKSKVVSKGNKATENRKSSTRCKSERMFCAIKDLFGLKKTPYRGLAKMLSVWCGW
jgi:hypothetical protein